MKMRIAAVLAIAILSVACQRETAPPQPAGSGQVTTETVIATEDASTAAIDVRIPLTANAVAQCRPSKTDLAENEPVHLTLDLNEVPEALQVGARILDDDERLVARVTEPANGRKSIRLTIEQELPAGTYTLEGLWGGNIVCEHTLEIGG